MENRFVRRLIGTLLGLAAAVLVGLAFEYLDAGWFPSAEIDPSDTIAMDSVMTGMSFAEQCLIVLGWLAGPLAGTLVASRIDHWDWSAGIITALFVALGVINLLQNPFPAWMRIAAIVAPIAGGLIGLGLSRWWLARRYARGRLHGEGVPPR